MDTYRGTNCLGFSQLFVHRGAPKLQIPLAIVPAKLMPSQEYSHAATLAKGNDGFVLLDVSVNEIKPAILTPTSPLFRGFRGTFTYNCEENTISYTNTSDPDNAFTYVYTLQDLKNSSNALIPMFFKRKNFYICNFNNRPTITSYIGVSFHSKTLRLGYYDLFFNLTKKKFSIK